MRNGDERRIEEHSNACPMIGSNACPMIGSNACPMIGLSKSRHCFNGFRLTNKQSFYCIYREIN